MKDIDDSINLLNDSTTFNNQHMPFSNICVTGYLAFKSFY